MGNSSTRAFFVEDQTKEIVNVLKHTNLCLSSTPRIDAFRRGNAACMSVK